MIPAPEGVKPIEVISKSKVETQEQLPAPEGSKPIDKKENETKTDKPSLIKIISDKNQEVKKCIGWNKPGCTSDSIKKVQSCMNVGVSGEFDDTLKNALASYPTTFAYKDGFNDSDVEKICRFKEDADKMDLVNKEKTARIQQKKQEMDSFSRQYPKQTTKAIRRDQF